MSVDDLLFAPIEKDAKPQTQMRPDNELIDNLIVEYRRGCNAEFLYRRVKRIAELEETLGRRPFR